MTARALASCGVLVVAGGVATQPAFGHLVMHRMCSPTMPAKVELHCGQRALYHAQGAVRWDRRHLFHRLSLIRVLLGDRPQMAGQLTRMTGHLWLMREGKKWIAEARERLRPPPPPAPPPPSCGALSEAACAWYARGDTQCEVNHEGDFGSVSYGGTYAGRFQMDYSFETETAYGRDMEARYGRASNWPAGAQIQHAYEVWSYAGWSRWPPYYRFNCAAYAGGSY